MTDKTTKPGDTFNTYKLCIDGELRETFADREYAIARGCFFSHHGCHVRIACASETVAELGRPIPVGVGMVQEVNRLMGSGGIS